MAKFIPTNHVNNPTACCRSETEYCCIVAPSRFHHLGLDFEYCLLIGCRFAAKAGVRTITKNFVESGATRKKPSRMYNVWGSGYMAGILSSIRMTSFYISLLSNHVVQAVHLPHLCPFDFPWVEHQLHMAVTDTPGIIL